MTDINKKALHHVGKNVHDDVFRPSYSTIVNASFIIAELSKKPSLVDYGYIANVIVNTIGFDILLKIIFKLSQNADTYNIIVYTCVGQIILDSIYPLRAQKSDTFALVFNPLSPNALRIETEIINSYGLLLDKSENLCTHEKHNLNNKNKSNIKRIHVDLEKDWGIKIEYNDVKKPAPVTKPITMPIIKPKTTSLTKSKTMPIIKPKTTSLTKSKTMPVIKSKHNSDKSLTIDTNLPTNTSVDSIVSTPESIFVLSLGSTPVSSSNLVKSPKSPKSPKLIKSTEPFTDTELSLKYYDSSSSKHVSPNKSLYNSPTMSQQYTFLPETFDNDVNIDPIQGIFIKNEQLNKKNLSYLQCELEKWNRTKNFLQNSSSINFF